MMLSEVFDRAAEILRARGWVQEGGWYSDLPSLDGGARCLEGAVGEAAGIKNITLVGCRGGSACGAANLVAAPSRAWEISEPFLVLSAAVREMVADGQAYWRPYHWNDVQGRTKTEVIALLERLALEQRAKEGRLTVSEIAAQFTTAANAVTDVPSPKARPTYTAAVFKETIPFEESVGMWVALTKPITSAMTKAKALVSVN